MKIYVIMAQTGEYSDTNYWVHSACSSEDEAREAVIRLSEVERVKQAKREMLRKAAGMDSYGYSRNPDNYSLYKELATEARVYDGEVSYYYEDCELTCQAK